MDLKTIVLLGCITGAFGAPLLGSKQCDTKCIAPSGFKEGRTYVYQYLTETSSFVQQERYRYSKLTISCEARLEVIGTCEIVLELNDVSVQETDSNGLTIASPNEDEFRNHLTSSRLRFGMQSGKVTSLCPSSGEPVWVTNFKRGVLSSMQLTLPSTTPGSETISETTVTGTCQTIVTAEDTRVTKEKDFMKCEDRYNIDASIPGIKLVPYAPSSNTITSEQFCRQEHNGDYVTFSECTEQHILIPIADPPTGPITTVSQVLRFDRIIKAPSNHVLEPIEGRKTILFDHMLHMEDAKTDATRALEIVSQLCDSLAGGVDTDTAQLYPALVYEMRRLESTTVAGVLASASCAAHQDTLEQIMSDALADCQSTGCIEIMVNLIKDGTIEDEETIKKWIVSLNSVNHPTKEMIPHLMELAEGETIRKYIYLTISSIINKYCTHINAQCDNEQEIAEALNFFEDVLGSRCRYQDKEEKRKMMIAIRAIGNAGVPRRSLHKCYESESTDISLRVAAIQAQQEMPCDSQQQDALLTILQKSSQDSELRITAYRTLMACPSQQLLDTIDSLLEDELSNQVGGYIVSHLKNIQTSQDPLKANQRTVLQDHPITIKFLEDPMKFSHNFEKSWYNETSGYGLAGEADVIFSSSSFIPRQVAVKGQFDAFGYAFEAIEFGGRMEGLNSLLESAFGSIANSQEDEETRVKRTLIKENKLENIIEDFEMSDDGEPDGNIYLRMFGRDVMFMDAEDIKALYQAKDPNDYLMEMALLAQGKTYEITKSAMVAENRMSVPLANGLEMKSSANISSVQRLKASGKLNILGMVIEPRSLEIDGTIEPSAAVDVSCMMEVDAHCARIAVNYELTTHTAMSLSGKISLDNGKNLQLQLRAPEQTQEIISVSSKVYFIHQEQKDVIPMAGLEVVDEKICTGDFLENAIGFRVCGDSKYQWMESGLAPLSGDYEFSLTAEKLETDLTSFDLEITYNLDKKMVEGQKEETDQFHLMFGTPGTEQERTYNLDLSFNRLSRQFNGDFTCPHHTSHLEASRLDQQNHQTLEMTLTVNEDSEYSMYFNFEKTISEDQTNFYPSVRVITPQFGTLLLLGSVINTESRVNLDVSLQGESRKFITVIGDVTKVKGNRKSRYDTNLAVGGEYVIGKIENTVQIRDGVITMDTTLSKKTLFGDQRSVTISAKHNTRGSADINEDFYLTADFSHSPESNFRVDWEVEATGFNSESTFKFCYGQTSCNGNKKLIFTHLMILEKDDVSTSSNLQVGFQHPARRTHLVLTQSLSSFDGRKEFYVDVVDHSHDASPHRTLVASRVGVNYQDEADHKYGSFEVSLTTPSSVKRLNQTWVKQASGDVSAKTTVQWQENKEIAMVVAYSKVGDSRHNADLQVIYPERETSALHFHVDKIEDEGTVQLTVHSGEEEKFFIEGTGNKVTTGDTGGSGSLRVRTPFNVLSEFKLAFNLNKFESLGFDSTLSLTLFPEEDVYSLTIESQKIISESLTKGHGQVTIAMPTSTLTLHGFAQKAIREGKGGLSLTVNTGETGERTFGIETKFQDQSLDAVKDVFFRINTTAPYHTNAIQVTVNANEGVLDFEMDMEYLSGKHFVTSMTINKKQDDGGFTFITMLRAPYQRATFTLDHTQSQGHFNPHLTLDIASFDVTMTLFDVDLTFHQDDNIYGKNTNLALSVSGPGKTLVFSTGVTRAEKGFNYFFQLANEEEVRLRVDLDTAIQIEETFLTNVQLSASSIYAPDWPVNGGVRLERSEDNIAAIVYFNVNDSPLFHFNATKKQISERKQDVLVRIQLPSSVISNLHDFGMQVVKEERDGAKFGSLILFWGPEDTQRLNATSSWSITVNENQLQAGGQFILAQPLRITHLQPKYTMDFSVNKISDYMQFNMGFDHGNGDRSSMAITHTTGEDYHTVITATLQEGKSFEVDSRVSVQTSNYSANVGFSMDDGDHHETARLTWSMKQLSEDNLDLHEEWTFEHSPSDLTLMATMQLTNNDALAYFGYEGQCFIPELDSPVSFGFETQLDKDTNSLMVHGLGPVNDILIRGNIFNQSQGVKKAYRLETQNEINGVDRPLNIQINYAEKTGDLIFETNEGDHAFHFGYLNDSAIQATLSKNDIQNAQYTVNLKNPHTLYNLITWEPTWPATLKEAAAARIGQMKERSRETFERYQEIDQIIRSDFTTYMDRAMMESPDLVQKIQEIREGLEEKVTEIKGNYQLQRESIRAKFASFRETMSNNLEPLYEEYEKMSNSGSSQVDIVKEHVQAETIAYFESASRAMNGYMLSIAGVMADHYMELAETVKVNLQMDREMIETQKAQRKERINNWVEDEVEFMRQKWGNAKENVGVRWEEFVDVISGWINIEEFENMKLAFQMSPMFADMATLTSTIMVLEEEAIENLELLRAKRMAKSELLGQDLEALRNIRSNLEVIIYAPLFATRRSEMMLIQPDFFDSFKANFIDVNLEEKLQNLTEWAMEQAKGYTYVANIEEGQIELWVYTDERYDDLVSLPVQDPLGNLKILGARLSQDFPLIADLRKVKGNLYEGKDLVMSYFHNLAEPYFAEQLNGEQSGLVLRDLWEWNSFINKMVYRAVGSECIKGEAILIGDQHYKTFDGSYYPFSGKCSFLLAQDFEDNNFTIAVEYNRDENVLGKSFTVIADGVTMEISNGRVSIDRRQLELPYAVNENIAITRDFSTISITSKKGFEASYNLLHDVFKVQLSVLYFGKTAGLFGNFNYEPSDDFVKSSGQVTEHIDEFTRSWEIGKKCTTHLNKATSCDVEPTLPQNIACGRTFLDGLGPASKGHPAVDPEPFYIACVNSACGDLSEEELKEKRCSAFQAYIEACRHAGLFWLNMPEECVQCAVSDELSFSGWSWVDVTRGADIVVILEQKSCMSERSQQVIDLMGKINVELKREGYRDNRFGVVGFGGDGIYQDAHVESTDGELFSSPQRLVLSLNDMQFDGEGMGDAWGAVSYALNYPFRAGVAKHVIFMACSDCSDQSRSVGARRVQKAMKDQEITFSVILDHTFSLGDKVEKEDNEIYGYDQIGVFTDKLAGEELDSIKGDPGLLHYINQPSNPCTNLAIATEGAVFSTTSMGTKNFKDVFALWIVKHSWTAEFAECTCTEQRSGVPQSICY